MAEVPRELSVIAGLMSIDVQPLVGIYFLCLDDTVVYVGKSSNIANRVYAHILDKDKTFNHAYYVLTDDLDSTERYYIDLLFPIYNNDPVTRARRKTPSPPAEPKAKRVVSADEMLTIANIVLSKKPRPSSLINTAMRGMAAIVPEAVQILRQHGIESLERD